MKKALFIPWAFTLLETYFPVADMLINRGFEVYFLNQLYDERSEAGNVDKMVNRKKIHYYKKAYGFTSEVEELSNLDDIVWIDVKNIGDILNGRESIIDINEKLRVSVCDYDLIVMRTEYNTWPTMNKWMKKTKVAGMPIRMMCTEINKKKCETGYIFYDQCYKAQMKYNKKKDTILYCYSGARNLYDPRTSDEENAIENQKDFLKNFIKIIVGENNKKLIIRGHPQYHRFETNKYIEMIVDDICTELLINRSLIIIRNDEFLGKELAQVETAIFDPGASAIMKGIMFSCNILYIDFPWRYASRRSSWYTKLFKKYWPDLFVSSFNDLRFMFKNKCFPIINEETNIDYFSRFFDGKCTERSVDFIVENMGETNLHLSIDSKLQSISNRIMNKKNLRRHKI
ncbi:MAG: hypothetical protein HOG49_37670 [Candidatus Scalindua sp.]|jgi:hypothetical protein|nr:hypothetical protein [Candidatus Scalindua sp.]